MLKPEEFKLRDKDIERINRQVNDIAYGNEQWLGFKNGAACILANKQKTYAIGFAMKEEMICCATGILSGNCTSDHDCEGCIVHINRLEAEAEIKAGLRRKEKIYRGCEFHINFRKDGSIRSITQVLR